MVNQASKQVGYRKIKRENVSEIRPKKIKYLSVEEFMRISKNLRKAVEKEEQRYGSTRNYTSLA